jgi:bla regulator protein blaR1
MSEAEQAEMEAALREGLAEADRGLAEEAMAAAEAARAEAGKAGARARIMVRRECRPGSSEMAETTESPDGTTRVIICERRVHAAASDGLRQARDEIARNRDIPEDTRKRILKELDSAIARTAEKEG